ncbi:E3 ubiquitin-protein ligase MIB2-like isoform X2 [Littorina saxatilis]|uniref:RING-type E3 ubiquitin transferase n=1 Tax=Littorina saxatilis TaxID=31220 RepID=A0AAN9AU26_9CAEN
MSVSGLRVLRGPDWRGGDTDGGEGHVGTVIELLGNSTVRVLWDMGQESTCSAGHDGKFEIRVLDTAQIGVCHPGATCAECEDTDFYGMLWRCQLCAGCDLCPLCYHDDKHDLRHQFLRIDAPGMEGKPVPKRKTSVKNRALGMFPGSKVTKGKDWQWGDQDGGQESEGEVKGYENVSPNSSRNFVKVQWPNGIVNTYRLGFDGSVDLTCVEEEVGPYFYRDHLPVLDTTTLFPPESTSTESTSTTQNYEHVAATSEPAAASDHSQGDNSTHVPSETDDTISSETSDSGANKPYGSRANKTNGEASLTESWRKKDSGIVVDGERDSRDNSTVQISEGRPSQSKLSGLVAASSSLSEASAGTREATLITKAASSGDGDQAEGEVGTDDSEKETFVAGDTVAIKVSENMLIELQADNEGFEEEMAKEIGRTGKVASLTQGGSVSVSFASGTYALHPATLAKVTDIRAGSTVRIRDSEEEVKILNTRVGWKAEMSATLGKAGRVLNIDSDGDVLVSFGRHRFLFAPACCVPAPHTKPDSLRVESDGKVPPITTSQPPGHNKTTSDSDETVAASKKKNEEMFRMLKERIRSEEGSRSTFRGRGDIRALLSAVTKGDHSAVRQICLADTSLVEQEHNNVTALLLACAHGTSHIQVVTTLLEVGANVNHGLPPFRTPLYACTEGKSEELMELLIEAGADLFAVDENCRNYLHFTAAFGMPRSIRVLASRGLDVNIKDDHGNSPLHVAIDHFKAESVEALVKLDSADLRVTNKRGFPALHWACLRDNARAVELILARDKSQVDEKFHGKHSPLHIAANNEHDECIRVLVIAGGANVNVQSFPGSGYSPLHLACVKTRFKASEALLEMGADPNVQDRDGDTPLHLIIGGRHKTNIETPEGQQECQIRIAIACMLISNGACIDVENNKGRNALTYGLAPVKEGVRRFLEHNPQLVKRKGNISSSTGSPQTLFPSLLAAKGDGDLKEALKGVGLPCGVCGASKADVTLLPCQHKCVCSTCSVKVTLCPLCDEEVKDKEVTGPDN